jgi:Uma2 family endonuclease
MREEQHALQEMSTRRPANYDDVLAAPEHVVAEIVDGDLITSPRPRLRHASTTGALFHALYDPFHLGQAGAGGWWILFEPELHLRADVLVPDLAAWRREGLPHLPDAAWMSLAPDWVCEVLSPATSTIDRARKLPIYAREGVTHVWLVDPLARTTQILRREGAVWVIIQVISERDGLRAEPFGAVEIDARRLWVDQ